MNKILVDIVHPADVLFFLWPIRQWLARGDDVLVLSREKDVACDLLREFDIPHTPISAAGSGVFGLALELIQRDLEVYRAARRFLPNVMVGFGGVAISHVGWLLGIPALSFYDTDTARLQATLTNPFITHVYVPEGYSGKLAKHKWSTFPGTKEMSYLHPENFTPDRSVALKYGLDEQRPNIFMRVVAWGANHDLGLAGWNDEKLRVMLVQLSRMGRVHISSERPLPAFAEEYAYRGPRSAVHHLLAFCNLYLGESATMAAEAVVLGVPAIYDGRDHPCYTRDLVSRGLIRVLNGATVSDLILGAQEHLAAASQAWRNKQASYLAGSPNLGKFVVQKVDFWASSCRRS